MLWILASGLIILYVTANNRRLVSAREYMRLSELRQAKVEALDKLKEYVDCKLTHDNISSCHGQQVSAKSKIHLTNFDMINVPSVTTSLNTSVVTHTDSSVSTSISTNTDTSYSKIGDLNIYATCENKNISGTNYRYLQYQVMVEGLSKKFEPIVNSNENILEFACPKAP